ncbi:hypothetical protein BJX61DRAFT_552164 [Aspergillus egyptiacus]|nr:hypothetical protein BJX61DRAFT_552164 [Aspergillus egyptiacus]
MSLLSSCALFGYLYISGSIFFDVAHYFFHQWSTSQWRALRWLSRCHQFHHLYYNRSLTFNRRYLRQNSWIALPLEAACLLTGSLLGWACFLQLASLSNNYRQLHCPIHPLITVMTVHVVRTLVVISLHGKDSNHRDEANYPIVPKDPHWLFVGPQFHALHHLHPDRYMGSVVKIFDWVAGTAYSLRHKSVAITGGSGALGSAIISHLQSEGVRNIHPLKFGTDWTYETLDRSSSSSSSSRHIRSVLAETDILILAHGTKGKDAMEANCNSSIRLIQLYLDQRRRAGYGLDRRRCGGSSRRKSMSRVMPEVWYVGSEIELHPAFGPAQQRYADSKRAFLPFARALYGHPRVMYRHIVPAAFQSPMGRAVVSPEWAAGVMMWWIRRGACYVPVTYTGIALLNFLKFTGWVRPDWEKVVGV